MDKMKNRNLKCMQIFVLLLGVLRFVDATKTNNNTILEKQSLTWNEDFLENWKFKNNSVSNETYIDVSHESEEFSLDCQVISSSQNITIQWFKNNEDVKKINFRFFYTNLTNSFSLDFKDHVHFTDTGTYKCIINDEDTNRTFHRIFHVKVKNIDENLHFLSDKSTINFTFTKGAGESILLDCRSSGAEALAKVYRWNLEKSYINEKQEKEENEEEEDNEVDDSEFHNGAVHYVVDHKQPFRQQLIVDQCSDVLELNDLQVTNSGLYSCIVSNEKGYIKRDFVIKVNEKHSKDEGDNQHWLIIISVSCVAGLLFFVLLACFLSRCLKSHWLIWWRFTRARRHSYHYKSSVSEEPSLMTRT